jgi:dihydrofolate reductase
MKPVIIVAVSENGVIGSDNTLPWHLPDDLKYFKQKTLNNCIIMGRKTFESIGKVLPGRKNIVVTRDPAFSFRGVEVANSLEEAIEKTETDKIPFITGGGMIFEEAMKNKIVDTILLTRVHAEIQGNVFFPEDYLKEFILISETKHSADEKHAFGFSFQEFQRLK